MTPKKALEWVVLKPLEPLQPVEGCKGLRGEQGPLRRKPLSAPMDAKEIGRWWKGL